MHVGNAYCMCTVCAHNVYTCSQEKSRSPLQPYKSLEDHWQHFIPYIFWKLVTHTIHRLPAMTMTIHTQRQGRKKFQEEYVNVYRILGSPPLKRSVFNRNFAVRIMLEQSHCQNIHSQSQNRFFKEFTIFLKIVPKKLPFAWRGGGGGGGWTVFGISMQWQQISHSDQSTSHPFVGPELYFCL